ncbi:MAG: 4-(cytidine 5'-diphospho)-2-C-methyl-D-erythritol kinase [Cypionkella sp.]
MTEAACAKINLALHVTGQRPDGYHLLDSLVVFAGLGDVVTVEKSFDAALTITGPQAASLPVTPDNLVLRAARAMGAKATITLEKHLPLASGIGGGSADAAATLRALARLTGRPLPDLEALMQIGSDLPACMDAQPKRMQGLGEILTPLPQLPPAHILLINPGIAVPTPAVFKDLTQKTNAALPEIPQFRDLRALGLWLALQRNDLEAPAIAMAPVIAEVRTAIAAQKGCAFARMSGSGATCFGLFATATEAESARASLAAIHPGWWCASAPMLS